jgi:hypothetical protein
VALIRTDVSEDRIASIFRVNEYEQVQSERVSSCIDGDSRNTTIISQKMIIIIVTAVETSNLTQYLSASPFCVVDKKTGLKQYVM